MQEQVKEKWLVALRSNNYKQTKYRLCENGKYCCLGVLCDVIKDEIGLEVGTMTDMNQNEVTLYNNEARVLPSEVYQYCGLKSYKSYSPEVYYDNKICTLDVLNDDYGLSFEQIADIIEEQL